MTRTYLITGASEGIGLEVARLAARIQRFRQFTDTLAVANTRVASVS